MTRVLLILPLNKYLLANTYARHGVQGQTDKQRHAR